MKTKPKEYPDEAIDYLDKHFPKGDKRRAEAMVVLALAYFEGIQSGKSQTPVNIYLHKEEIKRI